MAVFDFTAGFYYFYAVAFVALAIASFFTRRFFPALAITGWITSVIAVVLVGLRPPVY